MNGGGIPPGIGNLDPGIEQRARVHNRGCYSNGFQRCVNVFTVKQWEKVVIEEPFFIQC